MDESCPAEASLGSEDRAMIRRINDSVMAKIGAERPKPRRVMKRSVRTLLLVAAIAALMSTAAYAASEYFMNLKKTDETVSGYWRAVDADGNLTQEQKFSYPDAGMVLTFEGPEEVANQPEFRCFYLPSEPSYGWTDADGWTRYLTDEHDESGGELPYIVSVANVEPGVSRYYIRGETSLVKEEQWGDWQVLELHSDYSRIPYQGYKEANFILLFDQGRGYLARVTGTAELETLEHIARELEIRESAESYEPSGYTETLVSLDPARG